MAVDLTSTQPLAMLNVTIEGVFATVISTDNEHWHASAVLPENVAYGRALRFTADYTTVDGHVVATVFESSELFDGDIATDTTTSNGWFDGRADRRFLIVVRCCADARAGWLRRQGERDGPAVRPTPS
ncbi:hypothetical protein ACQPYH_29065 [Kribbella sp. CA-245084]|uniref:hypothetical protein n=1 Tax=Kribbella sp. CA-245084 TaxID=3239940 RepID=UPI003D931036